MGQDPIELGAEQTQNKKIILAPNILQHKYKTRDNKCIQQKREDKLIMKKC